MAQMSFDEFVNAVRYAPITPMQALELFHRVYKYMEAENHFQESSTPESEALARWEKSDREQEYESLRLKLKCGIPPISVFKRSIY